MVKMLTIPVCTISNLQVFFAEKCECKSYSHFFPAKILVYMPYLMIKVLTDTLTNDIFSFEQLGSGVLQRQLGL